jgi:hypothetical protein
VAGSVATHELVARLGRAAPFALVAGAVSVAAWRLPYGVDFTDESFYVVVPLRFVDGARPYVDETSVTQQTAALLSVPFVWAYHLVAAETAIVLAVRIAALVLAVAAAFAIGSAVRLLAGNQAAAVAAGCVVAFAPFDIRSLSYNTYAALLFAAGCFLAAAARSRRTELSAGGAHGLAAFAYPPLALVVLPLVAARVVTGGRRRLAYALPAVAVPLAGASALVEIAGPATIVRDFRNSSRDLGQGGGLAKLAAIAHQEGGTFHRWPLLLALVAALVAVWLWQRTLAVFVLPLLPLAAVDRGFEAYSGSLEWVTVFGAFAPALAVLVRAHPATARLVGWVWLPSLCAGMVTAYSSANGGVNFGVGFFGGAVVSAVLLVLAAEQASARRVLRGTGAAVSGIAVVSVLLILLVLPVYRDGPLSTLTARVPSGSFAGLLTSPRKERYLLSLQRQLAPLRASCRIFVFDDFPGGYLLSAATPETNSAWTAQVSPAHTAAYAGAAVTYLRRHGLPDVIVMTRRIPYAPPGSARVEGYQANDPLLRLVRSRAYRPVARSFDDVVYRLRSGRLCYDSRA